jgi:beta-lactam-binding protein with PASTA domain
MPLWTADGYPGWTADGYPGWSADGYFNPLTPGYVPNVVGMQSYQAYVAVNQVGILVNTFVYANSNSVPAGYVISQSLAAFTTVPTGTVIVLTVSLGPATSVATVTVPNVTGLYVWNAIKTLVNLGLIVEPIIYAASVPVSAETVISQSLTAGTVVLQWSPIQLIVSNGLP